MISRRDNLLIRPWQQRRYDNHRNKVQSATPAIDTRAPLPRQHVALKLKKKQKESERCQEIEKNNFNLLKRLSYVMRTNRVDNFWQTPQPNFLNRVTMYDAKAPKFESLYIDEPKKVQERPLNRKSKCLACTPQIPTEIKTPEERVPWEPAKPSVSRFRSQSVPVRKLVTEKPKAPKSAVINRIAPTSDVKKETRGRKFSAKEPQSIVLTRGCLKLSINFPSDTLVKLEKMGREKILVENLCHCRNATGPVA